MSRAALVLFTSLVPTYKPGSWPLFLIRCHYHLLLLPSSPPRACNTFHSARSAGSCITFMLVFAVLPGDHGFLPACYISSLYYPAMWHGFSYIFIAGINNIKTLRASCNMHPTSLTTCLLLSWVSSARIASIYIAIVTQ